MAYDVVVVGGGNAAMCAALSAREQGARVLVLEKAPEAWRGGNGFFTAGGFRFAFKSFEEVCDLVGDLSDEERASMDIPLYTEDAYYDDLMRVTEDLSDADLALTLVRESQPTMKWMKAQGIRWIPMFGRQAYKVGGKFTFFGNLILEAVGGGPGLIDMEYESAKKVGIDVRFEAKAQRLVTDARNRVTGVEIRKADGTVETIEAKAVVLASGGFEANIEMRTRYLGPNWDLARVRGTPYNTGDGIRMALEVGAQPWGHWSGCHAVQWDYNAPWHGDRKVGDNFQKHSYPLGIIVNVNGERFVDEGADMRNYTYVKYGREVIKQPRRAAFQIFDQKVIELCREEYRIREVTKAEANTIEELATKLEIDVAGFVKTVNDFNASVHAGDEVQPRGEGRPRHPRARAAEVELGEPARHTALLRLRGDDRHHVHVRRPAHHRGRRRARQRRARDRGPVCRGRAGGRALLQQLPGRRGAHGRLGVRPDRRPLGRAGGPLMRRGLIVVALLLVAGAAVTPAAAQTFEGAVSAKLMPDGGREPMEVQYLLRQGVMRMEMNRGDAAAVMIVDPTAKTSYMLMPQRRMYMVMPMVQGAGTETQRPAPEVVRTGRKEKIAGYECEHWLVKDATGDVDACVATGLGAFAMGAPGREASWTGVFREQRGFPLKVSKAGTGTMMEVTKIEPKRLDAALFTPPADYKKMEMPAGMPVAPRQR